jgi:hypothetical protein
MARQQPTHIKIAQLRQPPEGFDLPGQRRIEARE